MSRHAKMLHSALTIKYSCFHAVLSKPEQRRQYDLGLVEMFDIEVRYWSCCAPLVFSPIGYNLVGV